MPNYFLIDNRVFLILRKYRQRGVSMVEGITIDGKLNITMPLDGVTFTTKTA